MTDYVGILGCPFCGGPAGLTRDYYGWLVVKCEECGAQGPCTEVDEAKAVAAWNARQPAKEDDEPAG